MTKNENDITMAKKPTGWLHTVVDYGPLLVFLSVYKFSQPPADSTFGEIAAVIYGTIAFMVAAVVALALMTVARHPALGQLHPARPPPSDVPFVACRRLVAATTFETWLICTASRFRLK